MRQFVLKESLGSRLPRLVCVSRSSRVYVPGSEVLLRLGSGLGSKDCVSLFFIRGRASGELIFTRRQHFFIEKKKK